MDIDGGDSEERTEVAAIAADIAAVLSAENTSGAADCGHFAAGGLITAILDELPVSVFVKDSQLRHVFVNKSNEALFNRPRSAVIGLSDADLYQGQVSGDLMAIDRNVVETGRACHNLDRIELADGSDLLLNTSKICIQDQSGEKWLVGISVDVTAEKKRQAELERARQTAESAERSKSEFLANMSHEIRTPMNGVMGMAELLAATNLDAKQKMFTDVIVKSGSALLTIINDILDFSKIDAGQLELMPEPFALAEAVEDVAALVSTRVAEKDLELIVRIAPDLPEMMVGDVGRIRQILTNLMGNAVKFTEKGHVYVNVDGLADHQGGQCLTFRVEDTGIGIPEDKCAAVFDKFSQVDSSATRRHEGTGLGLSIASSLVSLMGGEIGVESKMGQGSTFWFTINLPVHGEKARELAAPQDVSGARVLVIDDNSVNRSILSEQFSAWNFEHAECSSGHEGLMVMRMAVERSIAPELVILDYQMPEMTGADVLKVMREDAALKDIPVIVLTSVDSSAANRALNGLGAESTLTKPTRSSLMLETMIQVISTARMKKSGAEKQPTFAEIAARIAAAGAGSQGSAKPAIEQNAPAVSRVQTFAPGNSDSVKQLAASARTDAAGIHAANGIDILVAEDNEVNQIVIGQILAETGHTFKIVENGRLAVAAYKFHRPRIILMDVSMPEMNGKEATEVIRRYEAENGIRAVIIGVTAHALKGDMEKCIEAGMDDYVSKPISVNRLREKIAQYLDGVESPVARTA